MKAVATHTLGSSIRSANSHENKSWDYMGYGKLEYLSISERGREGGRVVRGLEYIRTRCIGLTASRNFCHKHSLEGVPRNMH